MAKEKSEVKEKPKLAPKDANFDEVNDIFQIMNTDMYGIDDAFIKKNQATLSDIDKSVQEYLDSISNFDNSNAIGNYNALGDMIFNTFGPKEQKVIKSNLKTDDLPVNSITGNPKDDQMIAQMFSEELNSIFYAMPEYENVKNLIPVIGKIIKMKRTDILNPNEFTKKFITSLILNTSVSLNKSRIDEINSLIEKYDMEKKIRKWVETSITSSVKPVAVFPRKLIFKQFTELSKDSKKDINSMESLSDYMANEFDPNRRFLEKSIGKKLALDPMDNLSQISTESIHSAYTDDPQGMNKSLHEPDTHK